MLVERLNTLPLVAFVWFAAAVPVALAAEANPQASRNAGAVSPLTVTPPATPKAKVVASTSAAPLASPNFTDADAKPSPLAMPLAPNIALGRQTPPRDPPPAGLLKTNPDLPGGFRSVDVGVTAVF